MSSVGQIVAEIYKTQSRRVFATLIRLLGDFDLAEEAMHEAFALAVESWEREGVPTNPRAWLVSVGRFKTIDAQRRKKRFESKLEHLAERQEVRETTLNQIDEDVVGDDTLRLIFTCCHPALSPSAQVALTLREVCGLTTEEIARAFLTTPPTIAQRIVRAKSKIRDAKIPYEIPTTEMMPERIEAVLSVIYLVFNEGYTASSGDALVRIDLTAEAIRLGRELLQLLDDPEIAGLTALMLLHDSRRHARQTSRGELILLDDQDRSLWDQDAILEGRRLVNRAFESGQVGIYSIQAAIALIHAESTDSSLTDWGRIIAYYDLLLRATSSPIVALNRAVAIAMRDGPEKGLEIVLQLLNQGELETYYLAHAAKADFLRRLNQGQAAVESYQTALSFTTQPAERRFLEKRLQQLTSEPHRL